MMDTNPELEVLLLDLRDAQDTLKAVLTERDRQRLEAMPEEVRQQLEVIDAEFGPLVLAATTTHTKVEEQARKWVLEHQEGGKAAGLEATFSNGRTTWDTKGLDKAMKLIPGLADYRKTGDPYVTIRKAAKE